MAYINGKKVLAVINTKELGRKKEGFLYDDPAFINSRTDIWVRIEAAPKSINSYSVVNNGYHTEAAENPPYPIMHENSFLYFGKFKYKSFTDDNNKTKYGFSGLDNNAQNYIGIELSIYAILKSYVAVTTSNYVDGVANMKVLLWNTTNNEYEEKIVEYTCHQSIGWGGTRHHGFGLKINIPNNCLLCGISGVDVSATIS